jgi:hypothetical protein
MSLSDMGNTTKPDKDQRGTLKIPRDLKREIKLASVHRGVPENRLIREMWNFWKAEKGKDLGPVAVESEFGTVTPMEIELIRAVLDVSRNPAEDPTGIGAAVLNAFIKWYRSKGP